MRFWVRGQRQAKVSFFGVGKQFVRSTYQQTNLPGLNPFFVSSLGSMLSPVTVSTFRRLRKEDWIHLHELNCLTRGELVTAQESTRCANSASSGEKRGNTLTRAVATPAGKKPKAADTNHHVVGESLATKGAGRGSPMNPTRSCPPKFQL